MLSYPRAIMRTAGNDDGKEEVTQLSWKVRVNARDTRGDHSSILEHKSTDGTRRKYSYLFWEASTVCGFSICISNASCVKSEELSNGLLQDALVAQGLSTDEAT